MGLCRIDDPISFLYYDAGPFTSYFRLSIFGLKVAGSFLYLSQISCKSWSFYISTDTRLNGLLYTCYMS